MGIFSRSNTGSSARAAAEKTVHNAPASGPIQDNDLIPEEIIAVIAAAVAVMTGGTGKIRAVRETCRRTRSIWATAGLLESTRPFAF